ANPAASKDIRRLVAQGRVIPDGEKVNTIRRVMLGLQSVGVPRVVAMPDSSNLCQRAREESQLSLEFNLLDMPAYYAESDTVLAASLMEKSGVDCLVILGGDGTNRAVARGSSSMPLVAISTGTNNVFPAMTEGTLAGMAAGLVAQAELDLEKVSTVSKVLEVYVDGEYQDLALVDVALSRERFVATRAIWDLSTLYEVFLTRAEPSSIGLSSVGARLQPVSLEDEGGLHYVLGNAEVNQRKPRGGKSSTVTVMAPIAPGVVARVPIAHWQTLNADERVPVKRRHCTVALDGERAFTVNSQQQLEVALRRNGPRVVDIDLVLKMAAQQGLFRL
ncbi:MAG TPA: NAD(+)/NADH kinase, partial [Dehalococcoidia bacterium]|nr:NAD(+)/NADH kinase [Dehalococcoidia bacterium]